MATKEDEVAPGANALTSASLQPVYAGSGQSAQGTGTADASGVVGGSARSPSTESEVLA